MRDTSEENLFFDTVEDKREDRLRDSAGQRDEALEYLRIHNIRDGIIIREPLSDGRILRYYIDRINKNGNMIIWHRVNDYGLRTGADESINLIKFYQRHRHGVYL